MNLIFFITLLAFTEATFAYTPKEGNISATIGPFINKTNFEGSRSGDESPVLGGIGLIANGDINDKGSLEIAMIHMNKAYYRDEGGKYLGEETELIHITMGYRKWINPYFSWSLAFSSAYTLGDPHIIHSDFPSGQEISTSARDTAEYGVDISVQTDIWTKKDVSLILDTRYNFNLTTKKGEYGDHYGILVALRFMVQEKIPSSGED